MRNINQLAQWVEGAAEEFGDPAEPVCQLALKWIEPLATYRGEDLAAGILDGKVYLRLGPGALLPLPLTKPGMGGVDDEGLCHYEASQLSRGVYLIEPSLNIPGVLHAYLVLYDVPDRVPWEHKIVVVQGWNDQVFREALGARR